MAKRANVDALVIAPDDPLAAEHDAVRSWVEDAVGSLPKGQYYEDVDLKRFPSGQTLLAGAPEQSRRYVLAALAQLGHWDRQANRVRDGAETDSERSNVHRLPGWEKFWSRRRQTAVVVNALMRRNLPFQRDDLLALLAACEGDEDEDPELLAPAGAISRALERFAESAPIDPDLSQAMQRSAERLRTSPNKDDRRLAATIDQLCRGAEGESASEPSVAEPALPAPAGSAEILRSLKRLLGMLPAGEEATAAIGPDDYPLSDDSPLRQEHQWLSDLITEMFARNEIWSPTLSRFPTGKALLAKDLPEAGRVVLAVAERHVHSVMAAADPNNHRLLRSLHAAAEVASPLLKAGFAVDRDGLFDVLLYLAVRPAIDVEEGDAPINKLIAQAEDEVKRTPLTEGERYVLWRFRASLVTGPALGSPSKDVTRLSRLIGDGARFYLAPGDAWAEAVNGDLTRVDPAQSAHWAALLKHALGATSSRPSSKWLATGRALVDAVGGAEVQEALLRWLPKVAQGRSTSALGRGFEDPRSTADVMNDENADALRGLLWLSQTLPQPAAVARAITGVALSAYKKAPGVGPRAVKVGNAAVYALSEMKSTEAVGQLALLKVRVRFGTAQKEIEKAFNTAAEALGLPRDEIEELGVPSYGQEEVGLRRETLGDYRAELAVSGSDAALKWFDPNGKALKSVPAKVKADHKEELKDLQQALKDVQAMLPAQRDRLDGMFLLQKSWPIDAWRERYLNHPLVGTIARRLIWRIDGTPALCLDGTPSDVEGSPLSPGADAQVTLWHPVGCTIDEVTAWRRRLEALGVTQPFKQAHREVYLLTDAERRTRTYSNRFAAHILRQHQFNALCGARGWKNRLRLMVDDSYQPPTKDLPQWGLRAEFWVEGIGDNYGTDTNETGVYLRLSTDQVRFYRTAAAPNWAHAGGGAYESAAAGPGTGSVNEPLALDLIPPLVFSEVMRDVDLFVGVASVGNDPTWADGGPEGRYRDYWQHYSFGELSGTATTRKQVLERLIPRLKIADRCTFADRFLVVRGQKRTYKIHLGSGNILMEPNDQYLCIVPRAGQDDLFLPFEGDTMLSIILSKALLLADDSKIKDPTITQQIDRP